MAARPWLPYRFTLASAWRPKPTGIARAAPAAAGQAQRSRLGRSLGKANIRQSETWAKKVEAGEDALFHVDGRDWVALGVADGVGGWSEQGIDPSKFSWGLMNAASRYVRKLAREISPSSDIPTSMSDPLDREDRAMSETSEDGDWSPGIAPPPPDPKSILAEAYQVVVRDTSIPAGSSTACLLTLCRRTGHLHAAVLGDSVYAVLRDRRTHHRAPILQHYFNCPKQLTVLPFPARLGSNITLTDVSQLTKEDGMDRPSDAESSELQLIDGDLVMLGTDGLWDNISQKEIEAECEDAVADLAGLSQQTPDALTGSSEERGVLKALAERLVSKAEHLAQDPKRISPWAKEARLAGYGNVTGGKVDDITLTLAWVRSNAGKSRNVSV